MNPHDVAGCNVRDKVVLITGAGHGIGRTVALALAAAGAQVVAVDRDAAALDEVAAAGTEPVQTLHCDIGDPAAAAAAVDRCCREMGRIDGLVNNAGLPKFMPRPGAAAGAPDARLRLWEVAVEDLESYVAVHTVGPFAMCRAAIPIMLQQGRGRLITVTTNLRTMVRAGGGPYGVTKAALEAMTAILAAELAATGVTVNVVIPGGKVNTRPAPDAAPEELARLRQPGVMVAPIAWLLSEAGDGVTGRRFRADRWDLQAPASQAAAAAAMRIAWPTDDVPA